MVAEDRGRRDIMAGRFSRSMIYCVPGGFSKENRAAKFGRGL